jgi:hypothetical protein
VRNVRLTRARGSSGRLTMSDRNGVEAMLRDALALDHRHCVGGRPRSSATVVVASMTGISMP